LLHLRNGWNRSGLQGERGWTEKVATSVLISLFAGPAIRWMNVAATTPGYKANTGGENTLSFVYVWDDFNRFV
jgi:hypothetical protein